MNGFALALPPLCGAAACLTTSLIVPRLPEPQHDDESHLSWRKPPYAMLGGPRQALMATAAGTAAGAVTVTQAPTHGWPLFLVLAGPVTSLVLVDAATTYLPLPLTKLCWLLGLVAFGVSLSLTATPTSLALTVGAAVVITALLFWALWRFAGGLGFGDVRLAPLLAAAPAQLSWQFWGAALMCATAAGALWGVLTALWRRRRPHPLGGTFPYGPGLWLGPWLALLLT